MEEDSSDLKYNLAFKEYAKGPNEKVKAPWVTIVISGVIVGIAYVTTEIFAAYVLENPYALNFLLALYGIPAGIVCGLKNDNLSFLTSFRYSSFSALFSIATFGIISAFFVGLSANHAIGIIVGIVELIIALAIILVFSVCVTFAIGAFLGTFIRGVHDSKN